MHRKNVFVITARLELAQRLETILAGMDTEPRFFSMPPSGSGDQYQTADLVIIDAASGDQARLKQLLQMVREQEEMALLLLVSEETIPALEASLRLSSDFILASASPAEYAARLRRLLWPGEEASGTDFMRIGSLTINLATYQVKVDGSVLELTYLEYALLAFLITHPSRTYSREALLRRVWGFDYFGGSRTVDVHVRRVRAKLGPELAERLKTVRGVGYLWDS
jgi:DNA-binding response OmpR family regulator